MSIMSQSSRWFFDGHTVTATSNYIYDSTNATSDESGIIQAKTDFTVVQVGVSALAASCLNYRIEGRFDTVDRWAEIYAKEVGATTTIDELIFVTEQVKELRVGVKAGNEATPNTFYAGVCLSEVK